MYDVGKEYREVRMSLTIIWIIIVLAIIGIVASLILALTSNVTDKKRLRIARLLLAVGVLFFIIGIFCGLYFE